MFTHIVAIPACHGRRVPIPALLALLLLFPTGCSSLKPTGANILGYHAEQCLRSIETLTRRLYLKNPKYENDLPRREEKLSRLFSAPPIADSEYSALSSQELLTLAFAGDTACPDRVYLLGLGLVKSIRETYGLEKGRALFIGMQVPLDRLQRLHHNISQVNWRMKTYRDENGELLFLTNEAGENGYINMGFEVLMTEILTRIQDDIHLRGGLPGKYAFSMSTLFLSILL